MRPFVVKRKASWVSSNTGIRMGVGGSGNTWGVVGVDAASCWRCYNDLRLTMKFWTTPPE